MSLTPQLALGLANTVLAIHLGFVLWVLFGALFTRGRPWLTGLHVVCAIYGFIIEVAPWPCPLTLLENWLEVKAGQIPYNGPFLLHYLDAIVYPQVPLAVLVWGASIALAVNTLVYARRWRHYRARPSHS